MTPLYKSDRQAEFCNLLETMEKRGFSQADVGRMIGSSRATISRIALGGQNPREITLNALRKAVNETGPAAGESLLLRESPGDHLLDDLLTEIDEAKEKLLSVERAAKRLRAGSVPPQKINLAAKGHAEEIVADVSGKASDGKKRPRSS